MFKFSTTAFRRQIIRPVRIRVTSGSLSKSYSDFSSRNNKLKEQFDKDLEKLFDDFIPETAAPETKEEADEEQINPSSTNPEFDLLNDFINQEYDQPSSGFKNIVESLDLHKSEPEPSEESNETHFDLDFLGMDKKSKEERKTIEDEKQLFQNIFESYMKPLQGHDKSDKVMWDLQDSVQSTKNTLDRIVHSKEQAEFSKLSMRLKNEMFSKTRDALNPTIKYIQDFHLKTEVVSYFEKILEQWMQASEKEENHESLYLSQLLRDATEFSQQQQEYVDLIRGEVSLNAANPKLNVITLPILVNQMIKTCALKFYDGQLAYSLFNILKKDVRLYTVACNQDTYNEVLRILWIYHGKSNLYNIEMTFLEMKNNGFNGDFVTFNILKQIIVDYHKLKMGKLDLNKHTGLPIWSNEDDKRVKGLERKLRRLADSLER